MERDKDKKIAEIDLTKNATFIVKDGKIKMVTTPQTGFGKQIIVWEHGKPTMQEVTHTEK